MVGETPDDEILLFVDDEPGLLTAIPRLIKQLGFRGRILTAANGDEALRLIEENGTNIKRVLTDFNMPGTVNGGEVAKRAKEMGIKYVAVITALGANQETV